MPNWSDCGIVFEGRKEAINEIVENVAKYGYDWGDTKQPRIYDAYVTNADVVDRDNWKSYAKAVREGRDILPLAKMKDSVHEMLLNKYGHEDWYSWRLKKWGCKWNISEEERIPVYDTDTMVKYSIMGPWNGPYEWFAHICERYKISGTYLDMEAGNDFLYFVEYRDGKLEYELEDTFVSLKAVENGIVDIEFYLNWYEGDDPEDAINILMDVFQGTQYEEDILEFFKSAA